MNNLKKEILENAKKESETLIIEMNEKFYKSSEIKKKLAENKIIQMKENAIKEIKNISAKIAIESVIKIINTSIDRSKLDKIFEQNLEEAKSAFKK